MSTGRSGLAGPEPADVPHLERAVELARGAVAAGERPFASLLVAGDGEVLAERINTVGSTGDLSAHPELAVAVWAGRELSPAERGAATIYTSAESCPMCAAAQVWAGVGRLVFVLDGTRVAAAVPEGPVRWSMSAAEVFAAAGASIEAVGPYEPLAAAVGELLVSAGRDGSAAGR